MPDSSTKIVLRKREQTGLGKKLLDSLRNVGIITTEYTGRLIVDFNTGGIVSVEKQEKLKL